MEIEKTNVLGVGISVLDQDRAREFLFDAVRTGKRGYVTVTGVHGVSEAQNDPQLKNILNQSLLCTPDGMPMVWMGKVQGHVRFGAFMAPISCSIFAQTRLLRVSDIFFSAGTKASPNQWRKCFSPAFPGLISSALFRRPFAR